jgi:hypothetical protein
MTNNCYFTNTRVGDDFICSASIVTQCCVRCLYQTTDSVTAHFSNASVGVVQPHRQRGVILNAEQQQTICANAIVAIAPFECTLWPLARYLTLRAVVHQKVVPESVMFCE